MPSTVTIDLASLANDLGLTLSRVERTLDLLDEGNTVAFITRYRKDQTGGLDEESIRCIQVDATKMRMLAERKQTILKSIESQGKLTPELAEQITTARSTKRLEDIYLPYKPKKQTLATIARQRGLEPFAQEILDAAPAASDLDRRAADFVCSDRQLNSVAEVLHGVGHLLAERFSEKAEVRSRLRKIYHRTGQLASTKVETPERVSKGTIAPSVPAAVDGESASAPAAPSASAELLEAAAVAIVDEKSNAAETPSETVEGQANQLEAIAIDVAEVDLADAEAAEMDAGIPEDSDAEDDSDEAIGEGEGGEETPEVPDTSSTTPEPAACADAIAAAPRGSAESCERPQ